MVIPKALIIYISWLDSAKLISENIDEKSSVIASVNVVLGIKELSIFINLLLFSIDKFIIYGVSAAAVLKKDTNFMLDKSNIIALMPNYIFYVNFGV